MVGSKRASEAVRKLEAIAARNERKAKEAVKKFEAIAARNEKKYPFLARLRGFVELMRPLEWSKSLFNMTIGLLIAFYVFGTAGNIFVFVAGLAGVFTLWSGLYALNDWTDWRADFAHKSKHIRPIPSGRVSPRAAFIFAVVLIIISFLIGFALGNILFILCMVVMLLNQLFYTLKPLRLKDRKYFDIISGAFVNPVFRYLSGLFLFVSLADLYLVGFPLLPVMFVLGIQVGSYLTYRFSSKDCDLKMNVKNSVCELSVRRAKIFSRFWILLGAFSIFAVIGNFYLLKEPWLGYMPWHYALAIIPGLLIAPIIKAVVKSPNKATDPESYKLVYASFHIVSDVIMIVAILIFLFFP